MNTVHWYDDGPKATVLDALEIKSGEGVSIRVGDAILYCLTENNLVDKLCCMTSDNANEPIASQEHIRTKQSNVIKVRCSNHLIQLMVDIVTKKVDESVGKIKELCQTIRRSKTLSAWFAQRCKELQYDFWTPPGSYSNVKWGSFWQFLNQCCNSMKILKEAVDEFNDLKGFYLHRDDWQKVVEIRDFLVDFNNWRLRLEPSLTPTMQLVGPVWSRILTKLESEDENEPEYLTEAKKEMLEVYEKYFYDSDIGIYEEVPKLMYILDPTQPIVKRCSLINEVSAFLEIQYGRNHFDKYFQAGSDARRAQMPTVVVEVDDLCDETPNAPAANVPNLSDKPKNLREMLLQFVTDEKNKASSKGFQWVSYWNKKKEEYPPLYEIQADFSPSQSTSCHSERSASQGKRVLDDRSNLGRDNFRIELLMKSWMGTGIDYSKYLPDIEPPPAKRQKVYPIGISGSQPIILSDDEDEGYEHIISNFDALVVYD